MIRILNKKALFYFLLGLITQVNGVAQNKNFPHEFNFFQRFQAANSHRSLRPYNEQLNQLDYKDFYVDSSVKNSRAYNFIFKKSVIDINKQEVFLKADPLFNFSYGLSNKDGGNFFNNTRGFRVLGDLGKKFSFESRFYENQMVYPEYLNDIASSRSVALGVGRAKPFKDNGFDAAVASGYISFSPLSNMNFQFGHGRHFFGGGYRSLLISDYAPDYPYLSGQYKFFDGLISYKHVNAWMHSLERSPNSGLTAESLYKPKTASFNMLSFHLSNQLEFSFFEGVVHKSYDEINGRVNPDFSFFLPVFGTSLLLNDQRMGNNSVYGIAFSSIFKDKIEVYGQAMFHQQANWGVQSGLKFFGFKDKRSFLLLEYNYVTPFSYCVDSSSSLQSYTHHGHEIAHPLGSGFSEMILKGYLTFKKAYLDFQFSSITSSNLAGEDLGINIFIPSPSVDLDLVKRNRIYAYLELGTLLNVQTQMKVFLNVTNRSFLRETSSSAILSPTMFYSIGFRTNLINNYFDQ